MDLLFGTCRQRIPGMLFLYPAQQVLSREINSVVLTTAEYKKRIKASDSFLQQIFKQPVIPLIGQP